MAIDYTEVELSRIVPLFASVARTATPNQQQLDTNPRGYGPGSLTVVINMTAVTATGTVTFKVEGVDTVSGATYTILTSADLAAVATTVLRIHPNLPPDATPPSNHLIAQDMVPPVIRITATHGNAVAMTYTATALFND